MVKLCIVLDHDRRKGDPFRRIDIALRVVTEEGIARAWPVVRPQDIQALECLGDVLNDRMLVHCLEATARLIGSVSGRDAVLNPHIGDPCSPAMGITLDAPVQILKPDDRINPDESLASPPGSIDHFGGCSSGRASIPDRKPGHAGSIRPPRQSSTLTQPCQLPHASPARNVLPEIASVSGPEVHAG
jgi:hypothetical protein